MSTVTTSSRISSVSLDDQHGLLGHDLFLPSSGTHGGDTDCVT